MQAEKPKYVLPQDLFRLWCDIGRTTEKMFDRLAADAIAEIRKARPQQADAGDSDDAR